LRGIKDQEQGHERENTRSRVATATDRAAVRGKVLYTGAGIWTAVPVDQPGSGRRRFDGGGTGAARHVMAADEIALKQAARG